MIDKFSMSRVLFLIRRYFNENARQLLMAVGVVFGIMLFFAMTINHAMGSEYTGGGAFLWVLLSIVAGMSLIVACSLTFSSMSTKSKRIVAMMVPASKAEKFVSLLLIYNVIAPIAIIICALLADTLGSVIFLHSPYFFAFFDEVSEFLQNNMKSNDEWEILFALIAFIGAPFVCSMATYTLGSALWPKKSFIKTFCALFAIQMLIPLVLPADLFLHLNCWLRSLHWDNHHLIIWGGIVAFYLFAACIYLLAWLRYRSTQLVQKLMMD